MRNCRDNWTADEISDMRPGHWTWHESNDMRTLQLVPMKTVHGQVLHLGGYSEVEKFRHILLGVVED